ncbi:MAG: hypothetical protein HRU03_07365 [Nanoarchaeales archaeon]|nr:hypothetical protein [Nanoarchaeales archaeon]
MDSREYFENVLEHFLVVHQNDSGHGYTISDLKLVEGTLKLDFRDAKEKALLDDINSLRFPLIEDLHEDERTLRVLPAQEGSNELTFQNDTSITGLSEGLKNFDHKAILVIELDDLKHAISLDLTVMELRLTKYDFGLVKEMDVLREIVERKYDLN